MNVFDVPSNPAFWQAPYPFYAEAMRTGESLFAISTGGYAVLGYQALYDIGRDPRVEGFPFSAEGLGPHLEDVHRVLRWGLFAMGAPQHKPLRHAVIAGLSAARVDALRPAVETIARSLRVSMIAHPAPDLVTHFTKPLGSLIFCRLIGLPESYANEVTRTIDLIGDQLNGASPERAEEANAAARDFLARLNVLQSEGTSDVMRDIAARLPPDTPATPAEIVAGFAFDNVEMLAVGVFGVLDVLMLHDDALCEGLASGAFSLKSAVQEAWRLATPAILTSRIAAEEITWNDHVIPAGSLLLMWWAAGNLDARAFPDPLRFDPTRPNLRQLAFGVGGHACIGRHLSTMAAEIAVELLLVEGRMRPLEKAVYLPRLARMAERLPVTLE